MHYSLPLFVSLLGVVVSASDIYARDAYALVEDAELELGSLASRSAEPDFYDDEDYFSLLSTRYAAPDMYDDEDLLSLLSARSAGPPSPELRDKALQIYAGWERDRAVASNNAAAGHGVAASEAAGAAGKARQAKQSKETIGDAAGASKAVADMKAAFRTKGKEEAKKDAAHGNAKMSMASIARLGAASKAWHNEAKGHLAGVERAKTHSLEKAKKQKRWAEPEALFEDDLEFWDF